MELEQYCETAGQQGGPGLTVAAPSFFCTYGLPPVIAAFKERYPDWEIRLVEANDRDLVDFLRAGVAELGISANGDTAAIFPMAASWIRAASGWFAVISGRELIFASSMMIASHSV